MLLSYFKQKKPAPGEDVFCWKSKYLFYVGEKMVLLAEKNVFFMKIVYLIQDNTFEQK